MSVRNTGREQERGNPNHPLEDYVSKAVTRIERLMSTEKKAGSLTDDTEELVSWWKQMQTYLDLYTPGDNVGNRLLLALSRRSLEPLFEAHLTEGQYNQLREAFTTNYKSMIALIGRFEEGPGAQPANAALMGEVRVVKEAMTNFYRRVHRFTR